MWDDRATFGFEQPSKSCELWKSGLAEDAVVDAVSCKVNVSKLCMSSVEYNAAWVTAPNASHVLVMTQVPARIKKNPGFSLVILGFNEVVIGFMTRCSPHSSYISVGFLYLVFSLLQALLLEDDRKISVWATNAKTTWNWYICIFKFHLDSNLT